MSSPAAVTTNSLETEGLPPQRRYWVPASVLCGVALMSLPPC